MTWNEWPAMETVDDKAMMKTPATKATTFVLSGAANASGNHTLYSEGCRPSIGNQVLEVTCILRM